MDKKYCDICKEELKDYIFLSSGIVSSDSRADDLKPIWSDFCYPCYRKLVKYMTQTQESQS